MATAVLATGFSTAQAARIVRVPVQQVVAWQRAGLVHKAPAGFSVRDLSIMRRLRALRVARPDTRSSRLWAVALRECFREEEAQGSNGKTEPLGARLVVRHGAALLDPLTQQFAFDFEDRSAVSPAASAPAGALAMPQSGASEALSGPVDRLKQAQDLFDEAVLLEEQPGAAAIASDLYRQVLALWPAHAPASVNLGTLLYNQQRFAEAEQCYRTAAEIDPDYALAFFDLGNVLDELGRLTEAICAYERALQLVPRYADAHYNLALAFERLGERRRALRHWMHYMRLDPTGPWAAHARTQAKKTLSSERLRVVSRYGKRA